MSPARTWLVSALVTFAVATLTVLVPVLGRQREHVAEHTSHPSSPVRRNAASQVELTRWLSREPAPTVADLLVFYEGLKPKASRVQTAVTRGTSTVTNAPRSASPPTVRASGSCPYAQQIRDAFGTEWAVNIAMRESRCQPGARNRSSASGLFQLKYPLHARFFTGECAGRPFDAACNIAAAAALYREQGRAPWAN